MNNDSASTSVTFTQETKAAFLQYLQENPSSHCVYPAEKRNLIQWLINREKQPSSQQQFSRHNYARKTFTWDEHTQSLLAVVAKPRGRHQMVIIEDVVADVLDLVHKNNGHTVLDATSRDMRSSYYGIL